MAILNGFVLFLLFFPDLAFSKEFQISLFKNNPQQNKIGTSPSSSTSKNFIFSSALKGRVVFGKRGGGGRGRRGVGGVRMVAVAAGGIFSPHRLETKISSDA